MTTPKERWKKIWKEERTRLCLLGIEHRGVSITVNGRDLWFQHSRWNMPFGPIDAHMSRAMAEHTNLHQFLTDIETGVDELDAVHAQIVREARVTAKQNGFKLP